MNLRASQNLAVHLLAGAARREHYFVVVYYPTRARAHACIHKTYVANVCSRSRSDDDDDDEDADLHSFVSKVYACALHAVLAHVCVCVRIYYIYYVY